MNATVQDTPQQSGAIIPQDESWSLLRWVILVTLVFGLHIGLIYALGSRKPIEQRVVKNQPTIRLATRLDESLQLNDPTLFALAHSRGFAARTWLQLPEIPFTAFRWTEPPRLLALPVQQLGEAFIRHNNIRSSAPIETPVMPAAKITLVEPAEASAMTPGGSRLRVNGGLTGRKVLNTPSTLPAWPAIEPLTNTLVRVLVDSRGKIFSPALQRPGSGSKDADQFALKIAYETKFAAERANGDNLTAGVLIFEWQTLAKTNAPTSTP